MKVTIYETPYVKIEKDSVKARVYFTLTGYWGSTSEMDRNFYNMSLAKVMSCPGLDRRFTTVIDLSTYDPSGSPTFAQLFERVGVRMGEMGMQAHVQVLPADFFRLQDLPDPLEIPEDDDTHKPCLWTTDISSADTWLDQYQ